MHDIDGANAGKAGPTEHGQKAHNSKRSKNEEDPNEWALTVHGTLSLAPLDFMRSGRSPPRGARW
jgi:hypothetical protein